jgi:2,2-dialkylglycine decarboxylase (pyruvate)
MAKMYTGGFEILSFAAGFHGLTGGSGSSTFSLGHTGYGPTMPGTYAILEPYCYRCPLKLKPETCAFACLDLSFEIIDKQSVGALAATIVEPILSAGGIIVPPDGYFPKLKKKCEERGMLLIFDEAITGLGRLGSMFAFEELDTVPDILALSKSLGGGIPLSTTTTSAEIEETIVNKGFLHVTSHMADPLPARAGLAVLEVVAEENLVQQAREKGAYLQKRLAELAEHYEIIGDVRGKGLLIGVELVRNRETKEPAIEEGARINQRCLDKGLLMNIVHLKESSSVFRIAPPLTSSYEHLDRAVEIFEEAIREEVS